MNTQESPEATPAPNDARPTDGRQPVLEMRKVNTHYGLVKVLTDVDMAIYPGEMVCLLGGNASGKSTTMKAVLGIVQPKSGDILYEGQKINTLPTAARVRLGIAPVPEARRLFPRMTVLENLEMGAYARKDKSGMPEDLERVFTLFPRLKERIGQKGGTLSGGEQQMLAMGRALMARPRILLLDEPSMGLSPILVELIFETIQTINKEGTTILLVEQNALMALSIANRGYVIQTGEILITDSAEKLKENEMVRKSYLGIV